MSARYGVSPMAATHNELINVDRLNSVGCWWHQQEPIIRRGNPWRLEQGMVIAMEPHVNHWHIQDPFLITADGPKIISNKFNTDELFACNG
jgi:Xaa-Pro aminopeptidase